jgi:GTPase involved in cell partitioning and DNA repair
MKLFNSFFTFLIYNSGGAGGKGNYYYLTNLNKAPRKFELGHKGEERVFFLELKLWLSYYEFL